MQDTEHVVYKAYIGQVQYYSIVQWFGNALIDYIERTVYLTCKIQGSIGNV